MLDPKFIRENADLVTKACQAKGVKVDVQTFLDVDTKKREIQKQLEDIQAQKNQVSKQIPHASKDERKKLISSMQEVDATYTELNAAVKTMEEEWTALLHQIPNVMSDDTPIGPDESGNKVIRTYKEPTTFDFTPKDHVALGEALNIIEIKKAGDVTGARFAYLKGSAAMLEVALMRFAFDVTSKEEHLKKVVELMGEPKYSIKPFIPVFPPVMIRPEIFKRMARLTEADKDERYHLEKDDLYLIGSAEHTLGPIHMDETLEDKELPIRYIGFSTSFRREAGSYGKDTKGILRMHQFDKLELLSFSSPENSLKEQDFFVAIQEYLMQSLDLPYQVIQVCSGDMGKPDFRQIDIETFMPGQKKYRETQTSDLMTDYQARRLQTRIKKGKKTMYAHTNDATAFAIGRTIIAIMENYQRKDGSVAIPLVLQPYMNNLETL